MTYKTRPPFVRQVEGLEYVGEGGVMATDSLDRGFHVQETRLLQIEGRSRSRRAGGAGEQEEQDLYGSSYLRTKSSSVGCLMGHDTPTSLHHLQLQLSVGPNRTITQIWGPKKVAVVK